MKHSIVFKDKNVYASFPLLQQVNGKLLVGFFTAPVADHTGVYDWAIMESEDNGETWKIPSDKKAVVYSCYDWPAESPREISDRFVTTLSDGREIVAGSFGFKLTKKREIQKSNYLFVRSSTTGWKTTKEKKWIIPNADIILTFPRHFQHNNLVLIPTYIVLKGQPDINRGLIWRSDDYGENWKLYNMFPFEVNANEMSFVMTSKGILSHIRSDKHPYIMESWSEDEGKTWTYPVNICRHKDFNRNFGTVSVPGGPTHLLRLQDNKILCTYSYRFVPMGIRAIVSEDEGTTWSVPFLLRSDGGFSSSLWKRKWYQPEVPPANDVGYPVSIQLEDGSILTAYYITCEDRITHIATTKWRV